MSEIERLSLIIQRVMGGVMNQIEKAIKETAEEYARKTSPEEEGKKLIKEIRAKYPQPPGTKLCQKCQEWSANEYGPTVEPSPWEHCHHEEPPEKPKKCWCTYSMADRSGHFETIVERHDDKTPALSIWWDIYFCPHCGKKL